MNREENIVSCRAVCIIGGDGRQYYLAQKLAKDGYCVRTYAVAVPSANAEALINENAADNVSQGKTREESKLSSPHTENSFTVCKELNCALHGCNDIILPFPLSPDGVTLNCSEEEKPSLSSVFHAISDVCGASSRVYAGAVKERSRELAASFGIDITDYGAMEEIALENAVPTAEGAVMTAMGTLNVTVRGSRFAVIGYGRCGSELARLLRAMGAEVYGIARSGKDRAKMRNDGVRAMSFSSLAEAVNSSEIVFNTVPFNVFDCHTLAQLSEGRVIIELASAPGGVDRECAARYGVKVIHAPSLPGKYAPKTAAEIISRALIPLLEG
jgi:dipicolinate synthase subunit A